MWHIEYISAKFKYLAEDKTNEKKRGAAKNPPLVVTPAPFFKLKPLNADSDEKFYYFFFHSKPTKNYFIAKEVAKKARFHKILKNDLEDDESVNHLAIFSSKQVKEIMLMDDILSSQGMNIGLYGYAIHGVHLYSIYKQCRYRLDSSLAHFMGCMVQRDKTERQIEIAKHLNSLLRDQYEYRDNDKIGHFLKMRYMYNMQKEYLEIQRFIEITNSKIPGYKRQTEKYYDILKKKRNLRKAEKNKIYTKLIESGEISVKWISEFTLYQLVKKNYPDAIFQYREDWLGLQSLDIYVPSKRFAIEYQGIQHFEPIDFFGGEIAYEYRIKLDEIKRKKTAENGVNLIYWHFNEPISIALLKEKLDSSQTQKDEPPDSIKF